MRPTPAFRSSVAVGLVLAGMAAWSSAALWHSATAAPLTGDIAHRVNPNTASSAELELLPGIGPRLAQRIVEHREATAEHPAFRTADDLKLVRGIGPQRVERLRPLLCFGTAGH